MSPPRRRDEPGDGQLGFDFGLPEAPGRQERQVPSSTVIVPRSAVEIARVLRRPVPTPEQIEVIEAPLEPLLVVAGAGSGKTETMAARVVWLVANGHVEPDQVLGLTFTRKAAAELAERVRARLRALYRRGLIGEPRPVAVSTYHSYASSVLGDHALRLGIEPGARLLGEAGGWQLVDELVERWEGDMHGVEQARATVVEAVLALAGECAEHLLDAGGIDAVAEEVIERIQTLPKNIGDEVPGKPKAPVVEIRNRMEARRALLPLVAAYQRRKREQELLDFGDQVALAARLAREFDEVGAGERERYRVVLLDEYQDTSHAQVVLLQSLFGQGHPVIAVGDPHQSIYAWRGASAGNLQRFPHDFPTATSGPAQVGHLSTSWRNDHAVLTVANELAQPLRHPPSWVDPALAVDVRALSARPDAGEGRVRLEWHGTVDEEARGVADIAHHSWHDLREDGSRRSIAVLCRTRSQFPLLEAALRSRNLPVEVIGLGGLLHVPEIADLRAALEVVHDPTRGDSLMRLLTGPAWRLGPPDLDALGAWARAQAGRVVGRPDVHTDSVDEQSLIDALDTPPEPDWTGPQGERLSDEGRRRLARLASLLRELRSRVSLPLPDLVLEAERALLLDVEVAARPGHSPAAARAHLDAFTDVAAAFADSGDRPTLGSFLGWLAAAEARERGLDQGVVELREDAVQLLTVHGAKGLEWDVVAVTGLSEGTFPTGPSGHPPKRSKGWLTDIGAVPFPLRGDRDGLPQWAYRAALTQDELDEELKLFMERCGSHEVAEERRLAYVAVTRARERLLLTGAVWGDGSRPREASRFMVEVRELAERLDTPELAVGLWTDPPGEGAENPRVVEGRLGPWPVDPLGARRPDVQSGADLVSAAMASLRESRAGAYGSAVSDWAPAEEPVIWDDDEEAAWARELELLLAERDAGRSTELTVRLPVHLSASRVVALAEDPQALAERLRRPMPEEPSPVARRGSAFHAWLEQRYGAATLLDEGELPGAGDDLPDDVRLERLQEQFLRSEWAGRTAEAVEVPVETPVGGVVLRGRIDAVFARPDGGWDVVDWKTGRQPGPEEEQVRAVQLAVYRLAWSRLKKVPLEQVGAAFFYAATGETVRPVDLFTEVELEELLQALGRPIAR